MKKLVAAVCVGMLLVGCGNKESAQAAIAPVAPKIDHMYSMKDGYEYGYEQAISADQRNAGQAASSLIMFKFAGQKDGVYQVFAKEPNTSAVTTIQCSNPCDFLKIMVFYEGEHVKTERMKATEGTIGWLVMTDAINGKLDQYIGQQYGKKVHVWFDEQKGISATPLVAK